MSTTCTEQHPLKPFLPHHAKALMLGSFPPPRERWTMDFYYPNFQNDMWRIFGLVFFSEKDYFVTANSKSFDELRIRHFLTQKGIALYDTAEEVIRHKGNASDQFLEIVKPAGIFFSSRGESEGGGGDSILSQIPQCEAIITTGQKATETLMAQIGSKQMPPVGGFIEMFINNQTIRCYRMPSSSRAYPKSLSEKAAVYAQLFTDLNIR